MATGPREVWGDLATTAFVESSPLFRSLDDSARRDLLLVAQLVTFAPGELVSGEGGEGVFLVVEGTAVACAGTPAGPADVSTLERGAFFGAPRVLGGSSRAWSLVARTELTAVGFPTPIVAVLAERFPKVRALLAALLAAREREAAARLGA
ncbi:cyclic nucleotide-binding domain-containing protein [Anaeromyxobacter terrae]|uniref:cyclic nucleotide-binding domain-containing protein n=1 Tax=Anaeromyxobacter terrae TaxID=2925406 RepID=UPI001F5ACF66|nr:cyclic nucleotide-binding domain-containing protein [Anaeromyxobacter sp. SG22]